MRKLKFEFRKLSILDLLEGILKIRSSEVSHLMILADIYSSKSMLFQPSFYLHIVKAINLNRKITTKASTFQKVSGLVLLTLKMRAILVSPKMSLLFTILRYPKKLSRWQLSSTILYMYIHCVAAKV